jgi:two-component system cell cycle sensor histidine kinase/response regulator CckA
MSKRRPTILVVDADALHRETLRRVLRAAGFRVLEATDYRSAENAHQQHLGQIDLLLTAVSLPGGNGYELAKVFLRIEPGIKVLFVSGEAGAKVSEFYGRPPILQRPFEPGELLARVESALESAKMSGAG